MGSPKMTSEADVHGDADERVKRHGDGQAECLADDLRVLVFCVAGEVRDVERERGPVADHRGERREEEVQEAAG